MHVYMYMYMYIYKNIRGRCLGGVHSWRIPPRRFLQKEAWENPFPRKFLPRRTPKEVFPKENLFPRRFFPRKTPSQGSSSKENPQGPFKVSPWPSKEVPPQGKLPPRLPKEVFPKENRPPLPPPPSAPRKFLTFLMDCSSWRAFRVDSSFMHHA